ncbi:aldehyde-activating protein [Notoacmeibacter marinus]|uniref:Aldehyde-activating protein n=1 Tax=Notoacmeibacter marinus TaxID=1876515 RepID=A0A231UTM7_9HYPH|nr:GFA family protein [Notoacmeibacter marinus]OXS99284.1 aldehyde-activating protein [Notoacmeibacter marinus]
MSAEPLKGQCLCGAVEFQATPKNMEMGVCHCGMCRRWSGGVWMAVDAESVEYDSEDSIGVYDSSPWGQRLFCKSCGTTLSWRAKDGSVSVVSAQAFDDPSRFTFTGQIFIDDKPDNYAFANETKCQTGEQFMAMVMAGQEAQSHD